MTSRKGIVHYPRRFYPTGPLAVPKVTNGAEFWQPTHCQWIEGEPKDRNFCGAPIVQGKPYCEVHCKRAYIGAPKKSENAFIHWGKRRKAHAVS